MKHIISTLLSIVLASSLAFVAHASELTGAVEVAPIAAEAGEISLDDFSAELISIQDKPTEATSSGFREAVVGIVNYLLTFLGLIAVGFIVYAGILMVTDAGSEENVGKAKNIMIYAGAGIIIVLLSYAIVQVVVGVQGTIGT